VAVFLSPLVHCSGAAGSGPGSGDAGGGTDGAIDGAGGDGAADVQLRDGDDRGDTGGGDDGGSDGDSGVDSCGCPPSAPAEGDPCLANAMQCTYGSDVRAECRDVFTCNSGKFQRSTQFGTCDAAEAGACPGSPPAIDGGSDSCSALGTTCGYGDGTVCACVDCLPGPLCHQVPDFWYCTAPPSNAGCPSAIANAGTTCTQAGLRCSYGGGPSLGCGVDAECSGGWWIWSPVICPQ
jgi:hypothetical protein